MMGLVATVLLAAAPAKVPPGLVGAWYDHGTLFLVLRQNGTGQVGANPVKWSLSETEKSTLDLVTADDTQHLPFLVKNRGKTLELTLPSTRIELDKGKLPPAADEKPKTEKKPEKPEKKKAKKP